MPFLRRNEIGWNERFRRCVYFFLRDELDGLLISEGLIKLYKSFKDSGREYPFVEMRELKPRARVVGQGTQTIRISYLFLTKEPYQILREPLSVSLTLTK